MTPGALREHLDFDENRSFAAELQALLTILDYSLRHHHWMAVELSCTAYHSGKAPGGVEGRKVKLVLDVLSTYLPKDHRKRRKKSEPEPDAVVPAT